MRIARLAAERVLDRREIKKHRMPSAHRFLRGLPCQKFIDELCFQRVNILKSLRRANPMHRAAQVRQQNRASVPSKAETDVVMHGQELFRKPQVPLQDFQGIFPIVLTRIHDNLIDIRASRCEIAAARINDQRDVRPRKLLAHCVDGRRRADEVAGAAIMHQENLHRLALGMFAVAILLEERLHLLVNCMDIQRLRFPAALQDGLHPLPDRPQPQKRIPLFLLSHTVSSISSRSCRCTLRAQFRKLSSKRFSCTSASSSLRSFS